MSHSLRTRSWWWTELFAPLTLVIVTGVIFTPVLFFGRAFADGDAVLQFYPVLSYLQAALRAGWSLDWNPFVLTGFPTAASTLGGLRFPLHQWLFSVADVFTAYHWLTAVGFGLTSVLTYAFVRQLNGSRTAGLIAGLALPYSLAYLGFAGNFTVSQTYWSLPALLICALSLSRHTFRQWRWWVAFCLGTLAYAHSLYVGHLQWPLMFGAATVLFSFSIDWQRSRLRRPWTTVAAIAMLAFAIVLAWPQLLPTLIFARLSARAGIGGGGEGALLVGDALGWLFPQLSLPKISGTPGFLYVGAVPLLLAIFGMKATRTWEWRVAVFAIGLAILAGLKYSPLYWVLSAFPVVNLFRAAGRWMYVGNFAIIVLAAFGFDYLVSEEGKKKCSHAAAVLFRFSRWLFVGLVAFTAVWSVLRTPVLKAGMMYFDRYRYGQTTGLPLVHYHQVLRATVDRIANGFNLGSWPTALAAVSFVVAAYIFLRYVQGRFTTSSLRRAIVLLTLGNLLPLAWVALPTVPTDLLRQAPAIANTHTDDRVFSFLPGASVYQKLDVPYGEDPVANVSLHRELLSADLNLRYGVFALDYYDNIMDRRSARVLSYLGSNRGTVGESLAEAKVSFEEKRQSFLQRLPMLATLNVGTILTLYPLEHPDLEYLGEQTVPPYGIVVYRYGLRTVQPRYYVATAAEVIPTATDAVQWDHFVAHLPKLPHTALIECDGCPASTATGTVKLVRSSTTEYAFIVDAMKDSWFIFGQNPLPGWTARIDGAYVRTYPANYVLQAVRVPVGRHGVEFSYRLDDAWQPSVSFAHRASAAIPRD